LGNDGNDDVDGSSIGTQSREADGVTDCLVAGRRSAMSAFGKADCEMSARTRGACRVGGLTRKSSGAIRGRIEIVARDKIFLLLEVAAATDRGRLQIVYE
jgi:hypothetical protein